MITPPHRPLERWPTRQGHLRCAEQPDAVRAGRLANDLYPLAGILHIVIDSYRVGVGHRCGITEQAWLIDPDRRDSFRAQPLGQQAVWSGAYTESAVSVPVRRAGSGDNENNRGGRVFSFGHFDTSVGLVGPSDPKD